MRKLLKVMDIFVTFIVVMVSWVYAYIQTHEIVYVKYVQFFWYIKYTSVKLLIIKKTSKSIYMYWHLLCTESKAQTDTIKMI